METDQNVRTILQYFIVQYLRVDLGNHLKTGFYLDILRSDRMENSESISKLISFLQN